MPWFKVDDNLAFHQKALQAGNAAMGLWVRAGSWCAQQLTDGYVPLEMARTLGTRQEAKRLVDARLWMETEGGYAFWQWSEEGRQPTRTEVEAKRKDARERQRRAREKAIESQRDKQRDSDGDRSVTDAVSHDSPDPTRPDPKNSSSSGPRKRATRLPDDWRPTEADVEWQRARGISDLLARRAFEKFGNYWRAKSGKDATKLDWSATWRNWLLTEQDRQPATARSDRPAGWEFGGA
jgi:hypothetical protein